MAEPTYRLYGLTVRSAYPLGEPGPAEGEPDVTVVAGRALAPTVDPPPGDLLLDFGTDEPWYRLGRHDDGYCFRIYGVCDFAVSADLGTVVLHPWAGMTAGMEPVMISGALCALLLYLRGHLVLHASAVELDGAAYAFIGHSGMGKSTLATLVCADDPAAAVITDDVLCVDLEPGRRPTARLGAAELRLRGGLGDLAARFAGRAGVRTSADQRTVLRPAASAADGRPLRALVIPRPTRTEKSVAVQRLPTKEAMLALLSFPRLLGWQDPVVLARLFGQVGSVVAEVPVLTAQVPWGPPFPPGLASELRHALG